MLKSNDKLNKNHESLMKLYPIKVKKVKAPKENKSEQMRAKGVGSRALHVAVVVVVGNTVANTLVVKAATKKAI